jgi:type II secretory pathway pseudopilin PulG
MNRDARLGSGFTVVMALIGLVAVATVPSTARAQDQTPQRSTKQQQGVLQIGEITIVGRVQKPIAAVDVAKIQPKLTLAELRQPFLDRIEEAVRKDPF